MKRILFFLSTVIVSLGLSAQNYSNLTARTSPDWFREGVVYQINPRSFSKEGTLKSIEAQLERIKDLGANIVYLLPVNLADADMDKSMWSPRQIKSGFDSPRNPYRAGDYFHVDPEYGTDQDLKDLVNRAHELGMKVMIDLVFAHCGPSAQVVKQHPDYFKQKADGSMDVTQWKFPKFDANNAATRAYFRTIMAYYVADFNVDGFRCDVADAIPLDFWEESRGELDRMNKDLAIVAEGDRKANTRYAFDANYGWAVCGPLRSVLAGKVKEGSEGAAAIRKAHEAVVATHPKGTLLWMMTENHDYSSDDYDNRAEKAWGHASCELGLAFNYAIDGVPFLFCGQEICFDKRVSIFGHDGCFINWGVDDKPDYAVDRTEKLKGFARMRQAYSSLTHGETVWIDNDQPQKVCAFRRTDGVSEDVLFVGNFSAQKVKVKLADGQKYTLDPWGYIFEAVSADKK